MLFSRNKALMNLGLALTLVFVTSGCLSKKFVAPQQLGGKWVKPEVLNLGHDVYQNNCMQCHGQKGDGIGPAAQGQNPPPRNFQQGLYKFQSTAAGDLPTDDDLKRTIKYGLRGTGMLPWDISAERLEAVTQYIKTFSPVWTKQSPGPVVAKTADPFGAAKAQEAVDLGRKVYHGVAQCYTCHASYAPLSDISVWSKELTGNAVTELRKDADITISQDSSYGHKFVPPDFTRNFIKSGGDVERIYEILNVGVNGSTMASWKGVLAGEEAEAERRQWALAYFVNSLYQLKFNDQARREFFSNLNR